MSYKVPALPVDRKLCTIGGSAAGFSEVADG